MGTLEILSDLWAEYRAYGFNACIGAALTGRDPLDVLHENIYISYLQAGGDEMLDDPERYYRWLDSRPPREIVHVLLVMDTGESRRPSEYANAECVLPGSGPGA